MILGIQDGTARVERTRHRLRPHGLSGQNEGVARSTFVKTLTFLVPAALPPRASRDSGAIQANGVERWLNDNAAAARSTGAPVCEDPGQVARLDHSELCDLLVVGDEDS
jgi:hypothetical protein